MTGPDRVLLAGTIIASMLLGLGFMIGLGRPWVAPRELRTMAWLQLSLVAMPITLHLLLLMVVLRFVPPLWLIVAVLLGQDAVYSWRLIILIRAHREKSRVDHETQ